MTECPICMEVVISIFENECGHAWCKQCHNSLLKHKHTTCVICRADIKLPQQYRTNTNFYIEWLLSGGEPPMRWRPKRHRRGQWSGRSFSRV